MVLLVKADSTIDCLIHIQNTYFNSGITGVILLGHNQADHNILKANSTSLVMIRISNSSTPLFKREDQKPGHIILLFSKLTPENIRETLEPFKSNILWSTDAKIVLVFQQSDASILEQAVTTFWNYTRSVNIIALIQISSNIQIYSLFPYECELDKKFVLVDNWTVKGFTTKIDLFPMKTPAKFQCTTLRIEYMDRSPYCTIGDQCGDGIEYEQINILLQTNNLSMVGTSLSSLQHFPSSIQANGGHLLLLNREIDLSISSLDLVYRRWLVSDVLPSYLSDDIIWLVPLPLLKPRWMSIIRPFTAEVWIGIFVVLIVTSVVMKILSYDQNFIYICLNVTASLLNQSSSLKLNSRIMSLFFLLYLLYCIIQGTGYNSSIIKILTTHGRYPPCKTLQDAVDANYIFELFYSVTLKSFVGGKPVWDEILKPGRFRRQLDIDEVVIKIANGEPIAAMCRRVYYEAIAREYLNENGKTVVLKLEEIFSELFTVPLMPINHPLYKRFSKAVLIISQAGLSEHWLKQYLHCLSRTQQYQNENNVALSLEHLQGVFFIFIFGIFISLFIFLVERLMHNEFRLKLRRNK